MLKEILKKEAKEILKKELNFSDNLFIDSGKKAFKALTNLNERHQVIESIGELDGFEIDTTMRGSSIGGIRYKGIVSIFIKPINLQGRNSAGIENEDIFVNELNKLISKNTTNIIIGNDAINGVIEVKAVGTKIKEYKKADAILVLKNGPEYRVSLKKDNASYWESSDTRYKQLIEELVNEIKSEKHPIVYFKPIEGKSNIYKMYNKETGKKITGIAKEILNTEEVKDIVFGGDEVDSVLIKTFTSSDFYKENAAIRVKVNEIVKTLNDLERLNIWPILLIRHDSTRDKTFGLRPVIKVRKDTYSANVIDYSHT